MFFQSETRRLKSAIAAQDAGLGQSLTDLARALNLETAGAAATKVGTKALGVARAHPVPVALAGAGLAWLVLRSRGVNTPTMAETLSRWEDEGGTPRHPAAIVDALDPADSEWLAAARSAKDAARDRLLDLYERGLATAEARASIAADQAESMAKAFRKNVAHLSAEAAERTAETRRRAWEALEQGGKMAERGMDQGRQLAKDHPVATSVAGLAVGAGILALMLRGRGLMKVLAPMAISTALAEAAMRLRRSPADKIAEKVEDTAAEVKKTARRSTRAAKAAAADAAEVVTSTARTAKTKAKPAAKAAAKTVAKTTRPARASAKSTGAAVRKSAAAVVSAVEDDIPNGAAKH